MYRVAALLSLLLVGAAPSASTAIRGMRHPALSPDGRKIAFDWHGDIWVCPSEGGSAERVTEDLADEQKPCWSPDGTKIAFSSDKAGNRDLFVVELATRRGRQLPVPSSEDEPPSWSPPARRGNARRRGVTHLGSIGSVDPVPDLRSQTRIAWLFVSAMKSLSP